jgi:predicted  nucleic acid-binding Zn-ribbon protein
MRIEDGAIFVTSGKQQEKYTLQERPSAKSIAVRGEKQNILGEINLEKMLNNLDLSVDLLQVAYNAVNGMKGLQKGVSNLQMRLADTLILSGATVQKFGYKTDDVIYNFIDAYNLLLSSEEEEALEILGDIRDEASAMREDAEKLGNKFQSIADDTEKVLNATIDQNTENYEKRESVIEDSNRMKAEEAALNALKDNLSARLKELNAEYSKLQKQQEKQEERAFALQLTGAILGALGMGVQTAMEVGGVGGGAPAASASAQSAQASLDAKKKERETLEGELKEINEKLSDLEAKLSDEKEQEKRDKLKAEREKLLKQKDDKNDKLKTVKTEYEALANSVKELGSSFEKTGEALSESAQSYNARLDEIFKIKTEIADKERENLVKLAEYAVKISNAVITKDSLDTAISSLVTAIGCLRQVVSHIKDMVAFWKSIETCCETLAGNKTIESVTRVEEKFKGKEDEVSLEKRTRPYKEAAFVRPYFTYLVRWAALHEICAEYTAALSKTKVRLNESIAAPEKTREEHWKDASTLAEGLSAKITEMRKATA